PAGRDRHSDGIGDRLHSSTTRRISKGLEPAGCPGWAFPTHQKGSVTVKRSEAVTTRGWLVIGEPAPRSVLRHGHMSGSARAIARRRVAGAENPPKDRCES